MDTPSPTQLFYAGEFRHSIDEKNRITIPSRWRRDGTEEFVILAEANDQFLLVMSPEEFSRMSFAVESDGNVSARDRRVFFRQLHARAQHGAADRQGRLVLPEELCKKVGLKGEVALVGGRGRFEIWNLPRWKRAHDDETPTYQHVANVIGL
jgi:MraZ protein